MDINEWSSLNKYGLIDLYQSPNDECQSPPFEALEAGLNVEMPSIEPRYFGGYLLEQVRDLSLDHSKSVRFLGMEMLESDSFCVFCSWLMNVNDPLWGAQF